jgi:hypothetical protein
MSIFSDDFGVSGKRLLEMLAEGKSKDELIGELDGLRRLTEQKTALTSGWPSPVMAYAILAPSRAAQN